MYVVLSSVETCLVLFRTACELNLGSTRERERQREREREGEGTMAAVTSASPLFVHPGAVIEQLDAFLSQTGCIRSAKDVHKLVGIMKESPIMSVRCVFLNVVKATKAPSTLETFMEGGGWALLNLWLAEAKKVQNFPLVVEILQVLQKLPVTVASLKNGNMGKLVKQLSKQEHAEVKSLAGDLLAKWMTIFRHGQTAKVASLPAVGNGSAGKTPGPVANSTHSNSIEKEAIPSPTAVQASAPAKLPSAKGDRKEKSSKKESKREGKSKGAGPPVESFQPPPGPLVALGKPSKEKGSKRPRDLLLQRSGPQLPPEKKAKPSPDAKGRGPVLVESEGFMNALSSQAARVVKDKKKKIPKINTKSKAEGGAPGESAVPASPTTPKEDPEEVMLESEATAQSKKKRVSWASEDNLVIVHYFDMDKSERAQMNRKSFLDAAQQEKQREREALESGLFSRDRLIEMTAWRRPAELDLPVPMELGLESEEKKVQSEREGKVLAQLFLSKSSLPPSPAEPDPEPDTIESEPKHIPLLEPNAAETPTQAMSGPPLFSPPPVGHGRIPPESPLQSPGSTIHQAQNLINYYSEGNNGTQGMPPGSGAHPHLPSHAPPPRHPGPPMQGDRSPRPGNFPNYPRSFPTPNGPGGPQDSWAPRGGGGPPGGPGFHGEYWPPGGGLPPRGRGGMRGGSFAGPRPFFPSRPRYFKGNTRICKHFVTHGCRLGASCRFLHAFPDDLSQGPNSPSNLPPQQQKPPLLGTAPPEIMDTSSAPAVGQDSPSKS